MVNKTGLPSFIVTLASFFTLRGVMLVISKRLVGKVQVDQITEQKGAKFFKDWIAHEWRFTEFGVRDKVFLGLVIVGGAAFIYGLLEQSFIRRDLDQSDVASGCASVGIIAAAVGFIGLLQHRRRRATTRLCGVIAGVGVVAGDRRYGAGPMGRRAHGSPPTPAAAATPSVASASASAASSLACLIPIPFDRHQSQAILTWTSSGLRPVIAIVAALIGIGTGGHAQCLPEMQRAEEDGVGLRQAGRSSPSTPACS